MKAHWRFLPIGALLVIPSALHALEHPPSGIVLNPTGRTLNVPVPVRNGEGVVGEVVVTVDAHDQVLVAATDIAALLGDGLTESSASALQAIGPAPVPVSFVSQAVDGMEVDFDRLAMALRIRLDADSTKTRPLSFTANTLPQSLQEPATVSAFLNYRFSLTQDWDWPEASGFTLDLDAAARLGGVVFENEASLGSSLNGFLCPIEAQCRQQSENTFRRRGTRAVYDAVAWDTRAIVGDTGYVGLPNQRSFETLGLSLDHNPQAFGKRQNQSTRSFNRQLILDRSATLELIINGVTLQRLPLQPGSYSLNDLPVALGANVIQAIITYDNGEREEYEFNTLSSYQLLDEGATTWGISGGLPSTWRNGEREYLAIFQGGVNVRHGISDTLTGYLAAQTDTSVTTAGAGFHLLTSWGPLHLGGTGSFGDRLGYAASASFETLPDTDNPYRTFRLTVDYASPDFLHPGDRQLNDSDILYPVLDSSLRVSVFLAVPLAWDVHATGAARYAVAAENPNLPGAVSAGVDRWSVDAGFTRRFFDASTLSLTAGYGNDRLLSFARLDEAPEWRFGLSFHTRLGDISVSGRHSFGNDVSSGTVSHTSRSPSDNWQTSITADNAPERGASSTAFLSHYGQRGETRLSHTFQQPQDTGAQHRTQFQHAGAIAFADGKVAVGAPVRNGFAIVAPHDTIAHSTVIVGNPNAPRVTGSSWFPAIITDLPAYGTVQYPLDATDIPPGYALGNAHLAVKAPYRAGYAIEVGSDMPLTAMGTLVDGAGTPIRLQSATATSPAHPGKALTLFTNSAGRFAAEGFSSGEWVIAVATPTRLTFTFTIPPEVRGFHDAATLQPDGAIPPAPHDPWIPTLLTDAADTP